MGCGYQIKRLFLDGFTRPGSFGVKDIDRQSGSDTYCGTSFAEGGGASGDGAGDAGSFGGSESSSADGGSDAGGCGGG